MAPCPWLHVHGFMFMAACSCLQLNDRLSLGQHRLWKRMAVKWTRAKPGQRALDVCCGSGDLALLLADAVGPAGAVTGLDFAAEMLQVSVGFRLAGLICTVRCAAEL